MMKMMSSLTVKKLYKEVLTEDDSNNSESLDSMQRKLASRIEKLEKSMKNLTIRYTTSKSGFKIPYLSQLF